MTSAVAVVGVTFNGQDVQDIDGLFLEITQGLADSPDVRGVDVVIPGADGQTARPRRFDQRKVMLTGWVRGSGAGQAAQRASYRGNVRLMLGVFDVTAAPADLVATLEDGSTATLVARTLSVASADELPGEFTNLSIELLAVADWVYEDAGS